MSDRLGVELTPLTAERLLRNCEQVVAVHDAFARKSVLRPERHFRGKASDRSGYRCDCDVRQNRNRPVARDDDHGATPSAELDVVDLAAVQSDAPPSARSNAARPARPSSPTHSSCGCFP